MKHVATRIAFLRELVNAKEIVLFYVKAAGQIADIMTKPLLPGLFHQFRTHLL